MGGCCTGINCCFLFYLKMTNKEFKRAYYLANRDKILKAQKEWYQRNKESQRKRQLEYYHKQKEHGNI